MNITLSTFLIILFLVPGFIFRRAYYSSPFPRKYSKFTLFGEISWIIIPSVILHLVGVYLSYWFWDASFSELAKVPGLIVESVKTNPNITTAFNVNILVSFTLSLWTFSFLCGFFINLIIRRAHLDKRFKIFSFDNEWYYYLSGEILDFPHVAGTSKEVGLTFIDVLTKTGEETILYSGICQKFDLKEDGGLASICLSNVQKKEFNIGNAEVENNGYKEIPSTFLVIPFENILNLNVRFFKVNIKSISKVSPPTIKKEEQKTPIQQGVQISQIEAVLLGITALILIVALISLFSKPEKTVAERDEDTRSSIFSVLSIILFCLFKFLFHLNWLWAILYAIGCATVLLLLILWVEKIIEKKKNQDKGKDQKTAKDEQ
jgi:hypothetical protein